MELKDGWRVQTELKCVEGWVSIHTEYWRRNGDGITFTYSEENGFASDDSDTDFEVGDLRNPAWYKDEKVIQILKDSGIKFDDFDGLVKDIQSVDDLYIFGKALYEIDQLF
mgnify:CR=1 FL=1